FADGNAPEQELANAFESAGEVSPAGNGSVARHRDWQKAHAAAWRVAEPAARDAVRLVAWNIPTERNWPIAALRATVGNPFRPVSLDTAWQTPTVVSLATAAYDDRHLPTGHLDRERLAVLADALEDAGCGDEQILNHLRSPGPHVRGCWPLDLLLA